MSAPDRYIEADRIARRQALQDAHTRSGRDSALRSIESTSPFRRSTEVPDAVDVHVTGDVPAWLRGDLVRTCPAVFEGPTWLARHWFDGLCMIYAFRIGELQTRFQSRLLESDAAREIAAGRARLGSFGTSTGRTVWQRIVQPIQGMTDNTNVNVLPMGDDLVALTEGSRQVCIDPQSLRAIGEVSYAGDGLGGAVMAAHPHVDFARQRVVSFATKFGASGVVSVYEHDSRDRTRRVVGSWRTNRVPYLHSFGLTPTHAILIGHPFTVRPLDMLWSNRGFIDHFEWRPQDGTRLIVMNRASGALTQFETDPLFVFHTVNAFERDGDTILDLLTYPDVGIMHELCTARMAEQLPNLQPSLTRIVMHPGRSCAEPEKLSDAGFEFPATNYRRVNGGDYRFAWGAADGPGADGRYESSIVKIDVRTGACRSFSDGERIYGEPVFVARPGGIAEDDGVLLAVGANKQANASALVIIDARTMALLASAEAPGCIPLGFHGSFLRA